MDESILALSIPIIAIVMGCSIPIFLFALDYLKKKHLHGLIHKERVAAIEKGMELPPWPEGLFRRFEENLHPRRYLRRGLVWLFLGITVSTAVYVAGRGGSKNAIYGLIPAGIGLACRTAPPPCPGCRTRCAG